MKSGSPAARPDVIRKDNVNRLKTKLVPQGANIPFAPETERILHERGVLIVPDFIANAGRRDLHLSRISRRHANPGVLERRRKNSNTEQILAHARKNGSLPRQAALSLAEARVKQAMTYRR